LSAVYCIFLVVACHRALCVFCGGLYCAAGSVLLYTALLSVFVCTAECATLECTLCLQGKQREGRARRRVHCTAQGAHNVHTGES
jgi:hypothetical protein